MSSKTASSQRRPLPDVYVPILNEMPNPAHELTLAQQEDVGPCPVFHPKHNSDGHKAICDKLLPIVRAVMLSEEHRCKTVREQVVQAVKQLDSDRFWGRNQLYSRSRAVIDTVILHYSDDVKASLTIFRHLNAS